MIGQTISHYTIIEKLGQGGMGVVYKAEDITLGRFVALKFLPPHLAAPDVDKARFMQEAKAASAISHPNVCTIYSVEEFEGQLFIAMEFVEGHTLRARKDSITFKQGIEIGIQIAEGLAAAHEKGIVHRDIKPENIMLRKDGMVQIMDFGLAKLRASGSKITRLTKEGSTVGTAGYMSPEQVQGLDTDHRSDIFSYGVVLYELLTGELPFRGVHETAVAYEIVNVDPPPMSAIKPEIDAMLDVIVLECLEKEPRERRQSIAQTALDLKRYKRESTRSRASRITAARPAIKVNRATEETETGTARRPWIQYTGFGLAAVLAVVVGFLLFSHPHESLNQGGQTFRTSINFFQKPEMGIFALGTALSPDGRSFAYTGGNGQLYVRRMDLGTTKPIPGTTVVYEPAFSPDGQSIVYYCPINQTTYKVSLAGSPPEALFVLQAQVMGYCWGADNTIYFGQYSGPICKVSATGGTPVPVTALDSTGGEISHRSPQLLPDGKTLLYYVKTRDMASFDEALIVAEHIGGERKVIIKGGYLPQYVDNKYLVYTRGKSLFAVRFDPARLELSGTPVPIENGGVLNSLGGACWTCSASGVLVVSDPSQYSEAGGVLMTWMDRSGASHTVVDSLRAFTNPLLSPDGQRIAVSINAANNDIWLYDSPRKIFSRFTFGWGNNDAPIWSPDGKYIFYAAEKGHVPNVYRKASDASTQEERVTCSDNVQVPVSFAPDGKNLAYFEKGDIWILPMEHGPGGPPGKAFPFIKSPANEYGGYFSPDGRWVLYQSDESGSAELYVTSFPNHDRKWQITNGSAYFVAFAHDGKSLYYVDPANNLMSVDIHPGTSFDFSNPRKLFAVPQDAGGMFLTDISPDGKQFLAVKNPVRPDTIRSLNVVTNWFEVINNKIAESKN